MKALPILKYADLREIMCLDHNNHINVVIVDDAALDKLIPLDDKVYDFMREEVVKPFTMSDIRHIYEGKYKKYLSVHYESSNGYFYTERDANGDYIKHYFPSFNEATRELIISGVAIRKQ